MEVLAIDCIHAHEWLIENEQAQWTRQLASQLHALPLAIRERDQSAIQERLYAKQAYGSAAAAVEGHAQLVMPATYLKWVHLHHPFVVEEVADPQGAFLLETV